MMATDRIAPTGAMAPGWKSGVAHAAQAAGPPCGVFTDAKARSCSTALRSSGSDAGRRMVASAVALRTV